MNIMQTAHLRATELKRVLTHCVRHYARDKHPFNKTWDVLKQDIQSFGKQKEYVLEHTDVVIIGGGIIGSSVAYWLKTRAGKGLTVAVIEKDPMYKNSMKNLSLGCLHQHFSIQENVMLSQHSAEFFRNIKNHLNSDVDIQYRPNGYLVLASEKYADKLEQNVTMQREQGTMNELLTPEAIKKLYPWINTEDVKLGSIGTESEGYFNTRSLLEALIIKNKELDVNYIDAEATGFLLERQRDVMMEGVEPGSFHRINSVKYRTPNSDEEYEINFAACILAAGGKSGEIAKQANIGTGPGLLGLPLPVEERKYDVYSLVDQDGRCKMGINSPLIMDSSGLWLKKLGLQNEIICGHVPFYAEEVKLSSSEFFTTMIQPPLHHRVPSLRNTKINNVHTEWFDYNTYDDTGIIGPHPYHNNLYIAAGFGNLGYQHAPGIGRAIAELLIDGKFMTIDLTRFCFDRLITDQPLIEFNIY